MKASDKLRTRLGLVPAAALAAAVLALAGCGGSSSSTTGSGSGSAAATARTPAGAPPPAAPRTPARAGAVRVEKNEVSPKTAEGRGGGENNLSNRGSGQPKR